MTKVVAITSRDSDWAVAVVEAQKELDDEFKKEVQTVSGWESIKGEEELLETQTFCAWYRQSHPNASLSDCLNNEEYAWVLLDLEVV